jgi:polyphosphate kinase 2 (PPK2 family)
MKEFRLSESDKKAPKHYDKIMHALKKVEQAYAKSPVAFHIIDSESKKEALLELLKCLLKDADYPKKSKELSFTLNRKLVKASVDEIIEVEKTKQE